MFPGWSPFLRLLRLGLSIPTRRAIRSASRLASPKSRTFTWASFVQADVSRLDITVHDPTRMGGVQSVGDLGGQIDDLRDFEPSCFSGPNQRPAFDYIPWR